MICPHCKSFNVNSAKVCSRCRASIDFATISAQKKQAEEVVAKKPEFTSEPSSDFEAFNNFHSEVQQEAVDDMPLGEELYVNEQPAEAGQVNQASAPVKAKFSIAAIVAFILACIPFHILRENFFLSSSALSIVLSVYAIIRIKCSKNIKGGGFVLTTFILLLGRFALFYYF